MSLIRYHQTYMYSNLDNVCKNTFQEIMYEVESTKFLIQIEDCQNIIIIYGLIQKISNTTCTAIIFILIIRVSNNKFFQN